MPQTSTAPSGAPYRAHRERQRRRILAAAQELFDVRGIDRVTMADIVAAAGIRASTLYEYFCNKDELVWTLVEEFISESAARFLSRTAASIGPALARITALLEAFGTELVEHPESVRFMAQFDAMYARDWSVDRLLTLEDRIVPGRLAIHPSLIREGIADGSLRSDLHPDLTMHSIVNAAIAAQRRLA